MIPCKRYEKVNHEKYGVSSTRLDRIQEWQTELCSQERLPMTHLTIFRNGTKIYDCVSGYQKIESRLPAMHDTIYRMYSMTKPIVSTAIMMLFEFGKLHISDPVHLYLGSKWRKENMRVYEPSSYDSPTKTYRTVLTIIIII